MNWKDARLQIALLALVFAGAMTHYIAGASHVVHHLLHVQTDPDPPFYTDSQSRIVHLADSGEKAGLHIGDRLLSLEGLPYHGYADLLTVLDPMQVGDVIQVEVEHKDTKRVTPSIALQRVKQKTSLVAAWLTAIIIVLAFPLFCILVGIWVVAARPRLANAWLLLGILLLFPVFIVDVHGYARPLIYFLPYWVLGVSNVSLVCLMLFGLYFPQRSRIDEVVPWLKWLFAIPLLAVLPLDFLSAYALDFANGAFPWLPRVSRVTDLIELVAGVFCAFIFIAALRINISRSTNADAQRRLSVLFYGAIVGLTPLLFIAVWSTFHGGDFGSSLPAWFVILCVAITFLFPLTLAYVVVVQRAMDVRILLRQGTQYALARGTLTGVRVMLGILLAIAVRNGFKHNFERIGDQAAMLSIVAIFLLFRFRFADQLSSSLDRRFFREAYSAELMLAELSEEARSFTETEPLLKTITNRLSETLHIDRIAVLLRNGHTFALQHAVGLNGNIPVPVLLADNSQTIHNLNREHRPATIYYDNPDGWLFLATEQERRVLRELESEVLLPLPGRTKLVGLISLGPKRSEEPYSRADLQMLQSVAMQTGLAIENSELIGSLAREASQRERLNREIEIAREVQERLLPQTFPQLVGVDCSGYCRPAQGVGGDYYDFILTGNGRLGIAIGDVSGKGISAALLMASLRASLRAVTMSGTGDLSTVVNNVNRLVFEASADNRYATFFFGVYDPVTRVLDYVNAGHNAPFIVRPQRAETAKTNGEDCDIASDCLVIRLEEGGPVVGLIEGASYLNGWLQMARGDLLIAFTDGISEAMNRRDDEWSEDRLIEAACKCTKKPAGEIVRCLIEEADTFTEGAPQHDDMTLAVMKLA